MEHDSKILNFPQGAKTYNKIAEKKAEQGDYVSSLSFLFSSLERDFNFDTLQQIAENYEEMGLLSLSNAFWFKYLSSCPDNKVSLAYEKLAVNYFYMDSFFPATYYFHQKLSKDGFISSENLEQDVINFFNQNVPKKTAYHIAYPFDKADWSHYEKMGKQALASQDYEGAEKYLSSIPKECLTEETSGELAISYFLNKKDKQMIQVCKDSLQLHGENVTAYCNLASLYHAKGDKEKSAYYYSKALEMPLKSDEDGYKLGTCAMEQGDHYTANKWLKKIVDDRPFDVSTSFFYAVSMANVGDIEGATELFCEIYKIYPQDYVVGFFAEYFTELNDSGKDTKNLLPLKYVREIPNSISKNYKRKINELFQDPKKGLLQIKKEDVQRIIKWALTQDDFECAKKSALILINSNTKWAEETLLNALIDIDVFSETKRAIITLLVMNGFKDPFPVVANEFFIKVKPRKVIFEKKIDGDLFMASYAICLSRLAFWNIDEFDKIAFSMNKIYKKLGETLIIQGVTPEEIAALCVCISKLKHLSSPEYVCKFFYARVDVVKKQLALLKGGKNDKNI